MNFRLFLAVEWGRAVGVKLECVRLVGGGSGKVGGWVGVAVREGKALAGWVAAVASPCTLILEVKGRPPPVVLRKWRIGDGLSNNKFLLLETFKSAFGPCNIFVVVLEEF